MWLDAKDMVKEMDYYEARRVMAEIIKQHTGQTARKRLEATATKTKQSVEETAFRTAGNLLTSFTDRRTF